MCIVPLVVLPRIRKKLPVAGSVDRSNDIQVRRRT